MSRILIVDDEKLVIEIVAKVLSAAGHEVISTRDALTGVELLKQQEFDLMLCDLNMTPMDGIKLLRLAVEIRPNLPVLMMTGAATSYADTEAEKLGSAGCVAKPFQVGEFLDAVQKALHRKPGPVCPE